MIVKNWSRALALACSVIMAGLFLMPSSVFAQTFSGGGPNALSQLPPSDFSRAPQKKSKVKKSESQSVPLAASQQDCQNDIAKISGERMKAINSLNALAKSNGGKLDPIAACPRFRTLVRTETFFKDFLVKNKDWCGVPDNIIQTISASASKDAKISVKACALAVQFRRRQQEAAAGLTTQAPKLPAGPL